MEKPAQDAAPQAKSRTDWPRLAARYCVISFFVCITLNCVASNLLLKDPQPGREGLWTAADIAASLIIASGVLSGIAGLIFGLRQKSQDTIWIAAIGLFLHGGLLFVAWWLVGVLRSLK